jgi:2-methylisocitrate lyase-like PEP mutase family enzyme
MFLNKFVRRRGMTQSEKASRLLELHHGEQPLVLVNAWDAASACIVEQMGFPAVATTSAGVANALGYADGQYVPWAEMVAAIRKICQAVSTPVTADIESGFAQNEDGLRRSITQVIEAGAVGVNLEDVRPGGEHESLFPLPEQLARIRAVRDESEKLKLHLVINARTDAFWLKGQSPQVAMENTLARGKAYLDAGADCVFVPGLRDPEKIRMFVDAWKAPINILAGAGVPSIPELAKLGIKRVSFGSGPMRAAMGLLRKIGEEAKSQGTYTAMADLAVPYDELNALLARSSSQGNR